MLGTLLQYGARSVRSFPVPIRLLSLTVTASVEVRLSYIGNMGILSAGLVIARRVSLVATASSVWLRSENRTRAMLSDLAIGLAPPIAQLVECQFRVLFIDALTF